MKNERQIVFDILLKNKYSNIELQKYSTHPRRAFITKLVYTVTQNYELLVYQSSSFLKKPVIKPIEIILVMAAAQHYFMDSVTDYAIVHESVNLAKQINVKFGGLVNAVLKKMIQRPLQYSQQEDNLLNLSINTSHPLWIVKLLKAQYGLEKTKQILNHHNTIPPIDIRFNPLKITRDKLLEQYPVNENLEADSSIFQSDALINGYVLIQDRNSQKLVNEIPANNPKRILDTCCAPGTKLTQLSIMYQEAQIIGVDLHAHRIALTKELVDRFGLINIDLVTSDILDYKPREPFDLILCDVPCSGLGVLRRKPDIKRRIQPEDLDTLQILQAKILDYSAKLLKEDGLLVYATCTLNKKENEKQIELFLERHSEFECVKQETLLGVKNNGDSFYSAHLRKIMVL